MKIINRNWALLLILNFLVIFTSYGQCEMNFKSWVHQVEKSDVGDIYISLNEGSSSYTFKLYDVFQGKVIKEKVLNDIKVDENVLLFDNVASSTYIIYVSREGCDIERSIGGMGLEIADRK